MTPYVADTSRVQSKLSGFDTHTNRKREKLH
jgi:hypothetical protein